MGESQRKNLNDSLSASSLFVLIIVCVIGGAMGLGAFTFTYGKGHSYLTNDPNACANCHIMRPHFDAWQKSSHHAVAKCNDCHTPKDLGGKYLVKALNGFQHSLAFTTQNFHEPIQIKNYNKEVTEQTCTNCHGAMMESIRGVDHGGSGVSCIRCHGSVGHRI